MARLGERTQGLVTAAQLRTASTGRQAVARAVAAGRLHRVRPRVYAREPLPALPRHLVTGSGVGPAYVLHVRAALLSIGGTATASGRTAAVLFGWGLLVEPGPHIEVAVRHGRSGTRRDGTSVVQRRAAGRSQLGVASGCEPLRTTSPVQTVLDCCRQLPRLQAVVLCDSALRSGLVSLPELTVAAARLGGLAGASRVRDALALADPLSGSVLESVFRVRLVDAAVSGFRTQVEVRDRDGCSVLRTDVCFEEQRLVVELDGAAWHLDPERDQAHDNALAAAGWRVLRFRWHQVLEDPDRAVALVREALAAA